MSQCLRRAPVSVWNLPLNVHEGSTSAENAQILARSVRSPSKSALLARVATTTGRGRGFAVHKAMDQVGAFAGPLLLAGLAALTGVLWPGLARP